MNPYKKSKKIYTELLNENVEPAMIIRRLKMLPVNEDVILFLKRVMKSFDSIDERELALLKIKKVLIQTPRLFDEDEYQSKRELFVGLKAEQKLFNPIKWVDAELEYIKNHKAIANDLKEIMTEDDMLKFFGNRQNLNRRMAEGLPYKKAGVVKLFSKDLVIDWIEGNAKPSTVK